MKTIQQIPFAVLGAGAAFTVLWGVANPMAAYAEVRVYTGVGTCALGDIGTPEQAKNLAKEKALQNAKEQAGVYLANYTKVTNTHLAANEITTITNNIIGLVGEVKYQQTPGEVNGQPVIVYTATLQANVDTDGIQDWLSRDEKQRTTIIEQTEAAQAEIRVSIERIDRITTQYNQTGSEQEKEQLKKEYNEADKKLVAAQKNLEGLELCYKGDYDGAIRLFREAIELDPKFAKPWNNMGGAYGKLGDYNKEIEFCRKAIELDPKDACPWYNMGGAYHELGNYDKAIECYKKAIELDPKLAYPWNNMGFAYGKLGDYNKEIECYKKAIELDPKLASPWYNMGFVYGKLGDYNKEIECYKKAIELDPKDAATWYNMGFAYDDLGDYNKAIECYKKAIELDPKFARPWNNMGFAYGKLGDYNKEIECCRKAIELDPKYASPWNNMGFAYMELGDYNKAIECCQKAIELDPKFASPWNNMGTVYYYLGNYPKAVECFRKAVELEPGNKGFQGNLEAAKKKL